MQRESSKKAKKVQAGKVGKGRGAQRKAKGYGRQGSDSDSYALLFLGFRVDGGLAELSGS